MDQLRKDNAAPLYLQIAEELRKNIVSGALRPGDKLPSEHTLMEQYRVSRMTVRNALRSLTEEGLVQTHHGKGSFCTGAPGKKNIDVLLNMSDHYFIPYYLQGISMILEQNHANLIAADTGNSNEGILRHLNAIALRGSDGVIVQGCPKPDWDADAFAAALKLLEGKKIPYMIVDYCYPMEGLCCAAMDEVGIGALAAAHLWEKGHRKIAAVTIPDDALSSRRMEGLGKYSFSVVELSGGSSMHSRLLSAIHAGCTAVFCYNDTVAQACMDFLKEKGYRVPEDLSIISVDNTILAHAYRITSVAHAKNLIGEYAAAQILSGCPRSKIFTPELVDRGSVEAVR